ncbi:hypothetical protein GCM10025866_23830 [Naasia aerilata]|uniref:Major facilitator superfamily (MFS) profile domain-containing protein n=1 Tax=Naasia aerilata TaxID=1162966 RepID=A0ABN6XNA9_9MICO|nr:hypothetical protein GCM10025866_23830 [Naasia aerilata]
MGRPAAHPPLRPHRRDQHRPPLLALDLITAGLFVYSQVALVIAVVVGGLILGVLNTVLTESVMEATDLPRAVASSSYSAVRFIGGAVAPPLATILADTVAASTPYFVAGAAVLAATLISVLGVRALARVNGEREPAVIEAQAIALGDA